MKGNVSHPKIEKKMLESLFFPVLAQEPRASDELSFDLERTESRDKDLRGVKSCEEGVAAATRHAAELARLNVLARHVVAIETEDSNDGCQQLQCKWIMLSVCRQSAISNFCHFLWFPINQHLHSLPHADLASLKFWRFKCECLAIRCCGNKYSGVLF